MRVDRTRAELQVEVGRRGDIEAAFAGLGLCGLVDRALQPLLIDHEPGLADRCHVMGGELDVVRLGAWPGQAGDRHVGAADLLRGECQRVERGDDSELAGAGPAHGGGAAAAGDHCEGRNDQGGGDEGPARGHGDHY